MEDTVDKFGLRPYVNTSVECLGASWDSLDEQWTVELKDLQTGISFCRRSTVFVSAVGGISMPRDVSTIYKSRKGQLTISPRFISGGWRISRVLYSTPHDGGMMWITAENES